jgi:hypothetical protein
MKTTVRNSSVTGALALFFLSGCVSTSFNRSASYEARDITSNSVRVLDSPPNEAFLNLGEIVAYLTGFPSDETVFRKARKRAAAIGADAIVLTSAMQVVRPLGDLPYSRQVASVTFTAIRFLPVDSSQHHQ